MQTFTLNILHKQTNRWNVFEQQNKYMFCIVIDCLLFVVFGYGF